MGFSALTLPSALLLIGAGLPGQDTPRYYRIAIEIEREGKTVGTPTLIAAPGVSASITAADGSYLIKASAGTAGAVRASSVEVSSELYLSNAGRWELAATPGVSFQLGDLAEVNLTLPKHGRITLRFRVDPVDKLMTNVSG